MNTIRFSNKTDFVAALEARRGFWQAHDAKLAKDHKAAEQKWLTSMRSVLRETAKCDYDQMKRAIGYNGRIANLSEAPSCPRLKVTDLDRVLASLSYTQAKVFNVDSQGSWSEAHSLLTWDPTAKTTVC